MRYDIDFGTANAGGTPVFTTYKREDTNAPLTPPAIVEDADGWYYFEIDWSTAPASSIKWKAVLAGIELSGVQSAPSVEVAGVTVSAAGISVTDGYEKVGPIVAKAAVQCGMLALSPDQIAAFDPFASTDANTLQMLALFDSLGRDLASEIKAHLRRQFSLTTAGGASSYALPSDYVEMVDDTLWSGFIPLCPVTPQRAQFLKAWNTAAGLAIRYELQGNRLSFPVVPGDGTAVSGLYISRNWVQTAASGTGPDSDHVTAATDWVLFDPELMVLGLKLAFLEAKGFDTGVAAARYSKRLEYVKGTNTASPALSLGGVHSGFRFIDGSNLFGTFLEG